MAFVETDLYLASGTASLYNSWTEYVTKFDTSSFYNWEQDNEPLYDLDERTHYLWEKLGYPIANSFSGIPGIMLSVSADANFAGESSGTIFKSVSSVINALPEIITYPIIIEVANFGSLGSLELNNLKFKDNGGIEIINRNFSKVYGKSSDGNKSTIRGANYYLSSIDLFNTLLNTKIVSLNSKVCSSVSVSADTRWSRKNQIVYLNRAHAYSDAALATGPGSSILSLGINDNTSIISPTSANMVNYVNYDVTYDLTLSADFQSQNLLDATYMTGTTTNGETDGRVRNEVASVIDHPITGYFYGNWFNSIKIQNCNGPVFIRNFAVDGASGQAGTLSHNTVNGYEIVNSKLTIENALAVRCKEAGFKFVNSDVVLNRGAVAMRNYTLNSSNSRSSYKSAGFRLINSNVTLSTSPYVSGVEEIIHATKNYYGIELINSNWSGGTARKDNVSSGVNFIQAFHNTVGIKADNSVIEIPGRLDTHTNDIGLDLVNSKLQMNECTVEYNQSHGVRSNNSDISYNQSLNQFSKVNAIDTDGQYYFNRNGCHLYLDHTNVSYTESVNIPNKYGMFYMKYATGVKSETPAGLSTSVPSLQILNNSYAKLIRPYIKTFNNVDIEEPIYGLLASVTNNSKLVFAGDGSRITYLQGAGDSTQTHITNVYAGKNSTVEFQGPTLIMNAGIDVLAEDNSVINFAPHRDENGTLLGNQFNLSSAANHTIVELHSTRACLVANKNSIINMENLGSIQSLWPTSQLSAVDQPVSDDIDTYVSAGYMQFYPNAQDAYEQETNVLVPFASIETNNVVTSRYILLDPFNSANSNTNISLISNGGMCVRALNGSIVNVQNVHFPCGWDNTSGIIYDADSGNCDKLRIWNIGPNSHLTASYCSVSGTYPSLAGYYGPSAVYLSGNSVASAVPSSVPDSGRLSVLDYYGASGATVGTNYGPFRIMVGVDGPAKFLNYYNSSALLYNSVYQTYAQGYNPSGSLSAVPAVSSFYKDIGATSAFYTTSAFIDAGYRNRIRLDQSAADTFANAKNGAIRRSGRVPFCTIYYSTNTEGGEGYATDTIGQGLGLFSVNIFDLSRLN